MARVLRAPRAPHFVGYPNGAQFKVIISGAHREIEVAIEALGAGEKRAANAAKLKKRGNLVRLLVPAVRGEASDGGHLTITVRVPGGTSHLMRSKRKRFIL